MTVASATRSPGSPRAKIQSSVVGPDPDGAAADAARRYDALRNRAWTEPAFRGRYPEDALADLQHALDRVLQWKSRLRLQLFH